VIDRYDYSYDNVEHPQLTQIAFESSAFDFLSPKSKKKYVIRNTPVINSKYLGVWQRARVKLRLARALGQMNEDIKLFGTNMATISLESKNSDIESLLKSK
jgi:hypothetical protein